MEFDRKFPWNLMKRALAIATSDERSDTPNAEGPNGEINFLRFCDFSNRIEIVWLLGGYALSAAKY